MDSEEIQELEHLRLEGRSETDEGPFYHESWWESYKGGVKGILGGTIIGAMAGLAVGAVATAALSFVVPAIPLVPLAIGFSGLGAVLGAHEFGIVGMVTGAVAGAHEITERRSREFDISKFAEIKREIRGLRAMIEGKSKEEVDAIINEPASEVLTAREVMEEQDGYRTTHCDEHCPPKLSPVFWKVALIGGTIGTAAGAIIGAGGLSHELLQPVMNALDVAGDGAGHGATALSPGQAVGATSIIGGSLGASFGINRDMFRRVFDITDRLFKGIIPGIDPDVSHSRHIDGTCRQTEQGNIVCKETPAQEATHTHAPSAESGHEHSNSTTFQDRLNAEAVKKALMELDPNQVVRH